MKKIIVLPLFLMISCASLIANESDPQQIPFNSSPLSTESQALIEQIEKQKEETEESAFAKLSQYLQVGGEALASIDWQSFAERTINSFPQENMLKLDDGSDWTVDQSDVRNLRYWKAGHIVLLYPRPKDTDKPFMFYNQTLNRTLHVNPYNGPTVNGPKTNIVVGLDHKLGHVYLKNGSDQRTSWAIDKAYWAIFQEWKHSQPIIIANYNKSWLEKYFPHFFPSYDYVLLNVSNINVIPVKPL